MKCGFEKCKGDGIATKRVVITYLNPGDGEPDEFHCCAGCADILEELTKKAATEAHSSIAYERFAIGASQ